MSADQSKDPAGDGKESGVIEQLRVVAGVVALVAGLVALVLIVLIAALAELTDGAAQVLSGAVSAIASIVGAYFGIKLGNDNAKAEREQAAGVRQSERTEAKKAQALAAIAPEKQATEVLQALGVPVSGTTGGPPDAGPDDTRR